MGRKIEIMQDEENLELWHWVILEYDVKHNGWHNIGHGLKNSYDKASSKAKEMYDSLKTR